MATISHTQHKEFPLPDIQRQACNKAGSINHNEENDWPNKTSPEVICCCQLWVVLCPWHPQS